MDFINKKGGVKVKVSAANGSAQGIQFQNLSKWDPYENTMRRQIANLEAKMKMIDSDKEMPIEQRINAKKQIEQEMRRLQNELQQYQLQKRQKEAAVLREAAEQGTGSSHQPKERAKTNTSLDEAETGVMLSLTNTKEQIAEEKKISRKRH